MPYAKDPVPINQTVVGTNKNFSCNFPASYETAAKLWKNYSESALYFYFVHSKPFLFFYECRYSPSTNVNRVYILWDLHLYHVIVRSSWLRKDTLFYSSSSCLHCWSELWPGSIGAVFQQASSSGRPPQPIKLVIYLLRIMFWWGFNYWYQCNYDLHIYSMKVLGMKMAGARAYGTPSLTCIQVYLCHHFHSWR